jgi:hypothetical protein
VDGILCQHRATRSLVEGLDLPYQLAGAARGKSGVEQDESRPHLAHYVKSPRRLMHLTQVLDVHHSHQQRLEPLT